MKTRSRQKRFFPDLWIILLLGTAFITACNDSDSNSNAKSTDPVKGKAKYVFLFIGDGMSEVQVNAAEVYKASIEPQADPDHINPPKTLKMSSLPSTGYATTYDAGSYVTHVGIYVGNNQMYHAGDPIGYADLNNSYWQQHLIGAGRIKQ